MTVVMVFAHDHFEDEECVDTRQNCGHLVDVWFHMDARMMIVGAIVVRGVMRMDSCRLKKPRTQSVLRRFATPIAILILYAGI